MFYICLLSSLLVCDEFFHLSVRRAISTTLIIRLNRTTERLSGLRAVPLLTHLSFMCSTANFRNDVIALMDDIAILVQYLAVAHIDKFVDSIERFVTNRGFLSSGTWVGEQRKAPPCYYVVRYM